MGSLPRELGFVIAKCNGREDVAAAVPFARQTGLEVAVRSGGHTAHGQRDPFAADDGPAVLRAFRDLVFEPGAAVICCASVRRWGVLVAAFGGAVSQVGEDDTAFSHRNPQVDFLAIGRWTDPSEDKLHIKLCRKSWGVLAGFSDADVYVNNLGQEDRVREAYGEAKYQRLVALKDRIDPENLFRLNANIPPSTSERPQPRGNG
jgi:Berberine and berberine like